MKQIFIAICLAILPAIFVCAQRHDFSSRPMSTGHSGTGDNIDVKYHRFEWDIDPTQSKRISGSVTTYFVTTENNVSRITFDFNRQSFNNSNLDVQYHGSSVNTSFPGSGNRDILRIDLPSSLGNGALDSVTIFYDGTPPDVNGQEEGCQQVNNYGYPMFYTLSESYEDRDWWPCKADMQDKIDSTDFIITTPSAYRPAANGKLVSEVSSGGNTTYTFKHRYPIASYLVAVAVSQYNVFDRGTVNINGTPVPVVYYISKGHGSNPSSVLNKLDQCKEELVVFSNLFGDYPFKNEKYGMYEFGWGGGMEHQTFSAMGWGVMNDWNVIAHELAHQWFGDKVTFATWNHLWLAEGFARYSEILAAEFVPSIGANPVSRRASFKSSANSFSLRDVGCVIPDADIASSNTIWSSDYGSSVYERGAMVVSMLRTLLGDTKFFQACRDYMDDPLLTYGSATTEDLQRNMEGVTNNFDLTGFFNSFAYGNGYPTYNNSNSIEWMSLGTDKIRFRISGQGQSSGSNVSYYSAVIPLRVQGSGGQDTIIVLYDQGAAGVSVGGNGITYGNSPTPEVYLGFQPTSVTFDPDYMSLAEGETVQTSILAVLNTELKITPSGNGQVAILHLTGNTELTKVEFERSEDGISFSSVGEMINTGSNTYTFSDEGSDVRRVFYRAKLYLATGEILFSKIVSVENTQLENTGFALLNNPVHGTLRMKVPQWARQQSLHLSILDMSGRSVWTSDKNATGGSIEVNVNGLIKGNYLLRVQSEKTSETIQFLIN